MDFLQNLSFEGCNWWKIHQIKKKFLIICSEVHLLQLKVGQEKSEILNLYLLPLDLDNLETFPCFYVFIITVHYSIQWYKLDVILKIK